MRDWLSHWPEAIGAAVLAVAGWIGKRHVARVDNHGKRLGALEADHVSHKDLDNKYEELRGSLTASINHATDVIREDVRELRTQISEPRK